MGNPICGARRRAAGYRRPVAGQAGIAIAVIAGAQLMVAPAHVH